MSASRPIGSPTMSLASPARGAACTADVENLDRHLATAAAARYRRHRRRVVAAAVFDRLRLRIPTTRSVRNAA